MRGDGESMQRRTFLLGGAGGTTLFALTACTTPSPQPSASPTATPTASATAEPAPSDVPEPVSMTRSRWTADPYALGAFSYLVVGGTPDDRQALGEPVGERLFFAGEATSVLAPATVDGARTSGERAALEVARAGDEGERIAVIGAGMAGAAAARSLTDAGFDVSVLEARERVGGRIDSRGDDDAAVTVELGAGMLTSEDSDLRDALTAAGVSVVPLGEARDIRDPLGLELDPSTVGADAVAAAVSAATARTGDVSVDGALTLTPIIDPTVASADGTTPADRLESELRGLSVAWAADPDQLSASNGFDDGPRDHGSPDNGLLVTGGYSAVIDDLLDRITVWTTSVVLEIVYTDDGVSIRLGTGESLQVDRVIVTVPAAVLATGDIRFTPPLPTRRTLALRGVGTGASDVIWLRFDEPFWSTDAARWSVVGGDLDIVEWINLEPSTGEAVLIGLVGGERAIALAELDDGKVLDRARLSLEPFLGA